MYKIKDKSEKPYSAEIIYMEMIPTSPTTVNVFITKGYFQFPHISTREDRFMMTLYNQMKLKKLFRDYFVEWFFSTSLSTLNF